MLRRLIVLGGLAAVMLALAGVALADHPGGGGTPFYATLTPEAECNTAGTACNLGQPGASGFTELRLNSGQEEICYTTEAEGLAHPLSGAHIHRAPAGFAGPNVVPFPTEQGVGSACVFARRELIKEIRQNPENFYVNVHTRGAVPGTGFPGGAIRGQLCGPGRGNCR